MFKIFVIILNEPMICVIMVTMTTFIKQQQKTVFLGENKSDINPQKKTIAKLIFVQMITLPLSIR